MRTPLLPFAFLAVSPFAFASTWTVDDSGGAHFATIQAAIDAASPGDLILVQPGSYAGFTLAKGVRVVAQGAVAVTSAVTVEDVPAGHLAVLASLDLLPTPTSGFPLVVEDSAGTVVLDAVEAGSVRANRSTDVRIRRLSTAPASPALWVAGGRVEIVESSLRGADGGPGVCVNGASGFHAVLVNAGGELHAARCSFQGGRGGHASCPEPTLCAFGGDGGSGLTLDWDMQHGGSRCLLSGIPSEVLAGGAGGSSCSIDDYGYDGFGCFVNQGCSLRHSGSTIQDLSAYGTATVESPAAVDPTLRLLETPVPGQNLTFRVTGPAGGSVRMKLGRRPTVVPVGGLEEDVLVAQAKTFTVGNIPAEGVIGWNWQLAPGVQPGTVIFAQATVTLAGGETRRTNSIPIVVR